MRRKIIPFLPLLLLLCSNQSFSQGTIETSFTVEGAKIIIYYEFAAEAGEEYEVTITLHRDSEPGFVYKPNDLSGAVGDGEFANTRRSIIWTLNEDEIQMFTGDDYYFEIYAEQAGGGLPWYTYVGGLVIGGGVAAAVLLGKKDEEGTTSLPSPPSRPSL